MSELRRDPINGRWVIVDTEHPSSPSDFEYEHLRWRDGICPFCYTHETMTPPEIDAVRPAGGAANTPGWQVRVVANKFPALEIEGELDKRGLGMFDMANGVGAHEIIIETPDHSRDISELPEEQVEKIIAMYCRREKDLSKDERFKYIIIFRNYGPAAGASLEHAHTQLIALPMVPKNVAEEMKGAHNYFVFRDRCIFCDIIRQEREEKERLITENKSFIAFCPYVSRFPFEFWIMPRKHKGCFCTMTADETKQLASILKESLTKLKIIFPEVSYNYMVHTAPLNGGETCGDDGSYHWHIEVTPQLTRVAGFEWGTGFYSVVTPPELAAHFYRDAR